MTRASPANERIECRRDPAIRTDAKPATNWRRDTNPTRKRGIVIDGAVKAKFGGAADFRAARSLVFYRRLAHRPYNFAKMYRSQPSSCDDWRNVAAVWRLVDLLAEGAF